MTISDLEGLRGADDCFATADLPRTFGYEQVVLSQNAVHRTRKEKYWWHLRLE